MERCKTCKWWRDGSEPGWGWCLLSDSDEGQPRNKESLAVAYDYDSYAANLATHESYGCVQHLPKDS